MDTDSFEEHERRKSLIEKFYSSQRQLVAKKEQDTKLSAVTMSFRTMMALTDAYQSFSGKKSKELFYIAKGAAIAEATVNTYRAAASGYATQPFFPLGLAMGTLALAQGLATVASIASTTFEGGGGAASFSNSVAIDSASYGAGTPGSPVVTQPVSTPQPVQEVTVILNVGTMLGDRQMFQRWFEDVGAAEIRDAVGRNVDFGLQPRS